MNFFLKQILEDAFPDVARKEVLKCRDRLPPAITGTVRVSVHILMLKCMPTLPLFPLLYGPAVKIECKHLESSRVKFSKQTFGNFHVLHRNNI